MEIAIYVATTILLAANAMVSIALFRAAFYSFGQKLAQFLLIWLVPLFGVLFVGLVLKSMAEKYEQRPDHFPERIMGQGD